MKNRDRLKTMSDDEWYQFLTGKELEILKFKGISFYHTFMEWLDEEAKPIKPFCYNPYKQYKEIKSTATKQWLESEVEQ